MSLRRGDMPQVAVAVVWYRTRCDGTQLLGRVLRTGGYRSAFETDPAFSAPFYFNQELK